MVEELDFNQWFEILMDELKKHAITEVDKGTAENDFNLGLLPEESAKLFIKQWEVGEERELEKRKIYISGKITNLPITEACLLFSQAETRLSTEGWKVINPMTIDHSDHDKTWGSYMARDIKELLECESIYMLSNWHSSKGARIERAIALEMNKQIIYEHD